jgi:hypothetical protein
MPRYYLKRKAVKFQSSAYNEAYKNVKMCNAKKKESRKIVNGLCNYKARFIRRTSHVPNTLIKTIDNELKCLISYWFQCIRHM